jgi:excisionase family DNA binding protein
MDLTQLQNEAMIPLKREDIPSIKVLANKLQTDLPKEFIPKLIGSDDEQLILPPSVYETLLKAVHLMAQGKPISIVPFEHELTTQEAADLINVSRPFLVKLLEEGKVPFHLVGTHRRVRFVDLVLYKKTRDKERRQALKRLTELSEQLGLYDDDNEEE